MRAAAPVRDHLLLVAPRCTPASTRVAGLRPRVEDLAGPRRCGRSARGRSGTAFGRGRARRRSVRRRPGRSSCARRGRGSDRARSHRRRSSARRSPGRIGEEHGALGRDRGRASRLSRRRRSVRAVHAVSLRSWSSRPAVAEERGRGVSSCSGDGGASALERGRRAPRRRALGRRRSGGRAGGSTRRDARRGRPRGAAVAARSASSSLSRGRSGRGSRCWRGSRRAPRRFVEDRLVRDAGEREVARRRRASLRSKRKRSASGGERRAGARAAAKPQVSTAVWMPCGAAGLRSASRNAGWASGSPPGERDAAARLVVEDAVAQDLRQHLVHGRRRGRPSAARRSGTPRRTRRRQPCTARTRAEARRAAGRPSRSVPQATQRVSHDEHLGRRATGSPGCGTRGSGAGSP